MKKFIKDHKALILALIYLLWPIDVIPEFLVPVIGPFVASDDLAILLIALVKEYKQYKEKGQDVQREN